MASTPPPSCSAQPTPEPHPDTDLTTFNWNELRTPPSSIRTPRRKPERAIQLQSTAKLRSIDARFGNPDSLSSLIEGTRALMAQKWKILLLYFAFDREMPECKRLWSRVEWRKWDVVEFLTGICSQYYAEVLKAEEEGVELVTKEVDEEFLALVEMLLSFGLEGQSVVAVREWERPGTKKTLDSRRLVGEDLEVMVRKRRGVEEEEDDEQRETLDGPELEAALPDVSVIPTIELKQPGWNAQLPARNNPVRLSGAWG